MKSLIIWLALLGISFGGTIDSNVPDSKYRSYGESYKCVVSVSGVIDIEDKKGKFFASGVIIKPRILITAAHVMKPAKDCFITLGDKKINILCSILYEDFANDHKGYDIAICFLEEKVDLDFYPQLYDKDDEVGKVCGISGFGMTGTYVQGVSKYDNKKRAGSNIVDYITEDLLVCSVNKGTKTQLEFLIAKGDSGGGLFIDQKLAGINSGIMTTDKNLDSNINDESTHTRISVHKKWIDDIVSALEKLE